MTRPPAGSLRTVPEHIVRHYAQRIDQAITAGATQDEIAEGLGVKQPTVSKLRSVLDGGHYAPGIVFLNKLRTYFGDNAEEQDGISHAEPVSTMTASRGRAIALLSQDPTEFPGELLKAIRKKPPAEDTRTWTFVRWMGYFHDTKNAWKNGVVELPGMNRK